jgi:hypothetical protein
MASAALRIRGADDEEFTKKKEEEEEEETVAELFVT